MPPEADLQTDQTTTGVPATEVPASTDAGGGEPQSAAPTPATTTTTGDEPTDLLSAVREVLKPKTAETSPAAGTGAGAPGTQPGTAPTGGDTGTTTETTTSTTTEPPRDLTEADFADVEKPSVKKRIETLIGQRAAARTESETLREPAGNWQTHVQYLVDNGITPQDAQNLYGVGALLARGDWRNFIAAVEPYLNAAKAALGEVIPEDLQRRVDEGTLSQEDASELSRSRAAMADANRRATVSETARTATADTARRTIVRDAMTQWEAGVQARDPDYARKRDAVTRYSMAMVAERGYPPDAATAVQWGNEALAEVNKLFISARPTLVATPSRPSSVAPQPRVQPEPKSLRQAVEMALARTRTA